MKVVAKLCFKKLAFVDGMATALGANVVPTKMIGGKKNWEKIASCSSLGKKL